MKLKLKLKAQKSRKALVYLDNYCVGTLPTGVLAPFFIPDMEHDISEEQLQLINKLLIKEARQMLLDYLAKAEHSEWQSRQLLMRHRFAKDVIDPLIAEAKANNYINDARYADIYIRSWLKRGIGKRLLISKLYEQQLDPAIWQPILQEEYDAGESADSLSEQMQRYLSRQKELPITKLKEKTYAYFIRKGYELDQIINAWQSLKRSGQ